MKIDITKLTDPKEGSVYIDSLILSARQEEWDKLLKTKFSNSSSEELDIMSTIWNHGYMKGAEAATQLSQAVYEALQKPK